MATHVIVPCGKSKIWNKKSNVSDVKVRDVYIGAPFKVNREYTESFGVDWVILSAKYGFLARVLRPRLQIQDGVGRRPVQLMEGQGCRLWPHAQMR